MSVIRDLTDRGAITPPTWLSGGIQYETITGSVAYGVASESSDLDIVGWAIPPRDVVFPHLRGEIPGFDGPRRTFEQFQVQRVDLGYRDDLRGRGGGHGDLTVFGIVKFFALAMDNNPNVLEILFTPEDCVLHCTKLGAIVREGRGLFLHKGALDRFRGYARSQLHKLTIKEPKGRRAEQVAAYGYDTKFAYHVVRLLCQAEQIATEGTIDLRRAVDVLRAIRRGAWSENQLRCWCEDHESRLEQAFDASPLPDRPDVGRIKALLLKCLEEHYGTLERCVEVDS